MSFKKYNEMELALLGAIAAMSEEETESISMEKGDISFASMEDYISSPDYLTKPNAVRHAIRRKDTFRKKEEQKTLAQSLGYDLSTENNSKKVNDLLAANHSDRTYLRGEKADKKYLTVQEEKAIVEREAVEEARDAMEKEHDGILGAIACDIETLTLDMRDNEYSIERLEEEYEELEEALALVAEKLENAKLRRNGIQAALTQNKSELHTLFANFEKERIRRFGW